MSEDIELSDVLNDSVVNTGVFDKLFNAVTVKLDDQYDKSRLTGADYANVYLGTVQTALQQAIAYALGVHTANAQVNLLEQQTLTEFQNTAKAVVDVTIATAHKALLDQQLLKEQESTALIIQQRLTEIQNTALTTARIAIANAEATLTNNRALTEVQNTLLVTANKQATDATTALTNAKTTTEGNVNLRVLQETQKVIADTNLVTAQVALTDAKSLTEAQATVKATNEGALLAQKVLTEEAQIVDRVTGALADVAGVVGNQVALYQAQAAGFTRDAEQKLLKILMDSWSVDQSTASIPPGRPTEASNVELDAVITKAKSGIGII